MFYCFSHIYIILVHNHLVLNCENNNIILLPPHTAPPPPRMGIGDGTVGGGNNLDDTPPRGVIKICI